jgi:diaminopimelate decarboxylase
MSFPYTQRLRPAEILIDLSGEARLIRRRETVEDLLAFVP